MSKTSQIDGSSIQFWYFQLRFLIWIDDKTLFRDREESVFLDRLLVGPWQLLWTIILLFEIKRNLLFAFFHWQFLAHPVMQDLMRKKWFGPFEKMKRSSWLEVAQWTWLFLNIWCLFDIVLFPFLFALFYIKHRINKVTRRSKGNMFWLAIRKGSPAFLSLIYLFIFFFLLFSLSRFYNISVESYSRT